MIKSVNILMPISVEFEDGSHKIFCADLANEKIYSVESAPASEAEIQQIMGSIRQQQEALVPDLPYEQIYEVLNTEKTLQEENNKHIFRRK